MPEKLSDRQRRQVEHISAMAVNDVIRNIEVSPDEVNSVLGDLQRRNELQLSIRAAINAAIQKHIKTTSRSS